MIASKGKQGAELLPDHLPHCRQISYSCFLRIASTAGPIPDDAEGDVVPAR